MAIANPYVRDTPPKRGFRETASGLLVPEAESRVRQVFTADETRLIARVTNLLDGRGVDVFFACRLDPRCAGKHLDRITLADGSFSLQCEHMDRVFARAF